MSDEAYPAADKGEPLSIHLLGNLLTFRARETDTQGAYSLIEVRTAPGCGAPPHRHGDVEAFYVLDGHYEIVVEDEARQCRMGDFVLVPSLAPHRFRNAGSTVARMLILNTAGGRHEAFFTAAGDQVPAGTTEFPALQLDLPRLAAAAAANGIELLAPDAGPPPPSASVLNAM